MPAATVSVIVSVPAVVASFDRTTLEGSEEVMVTSSPPVGAGALNEAVLLVCRSLPRVRSISVILAALTCTVAVASLIPAADARNVVLPAPAPVTSIQTRLSPAGIVAVEGTVAIKGSSELRVKVIPPAGAGAESLRDILVVRVTTVDTDVGLKLAVTVTTTLRVSCAKPIAVAVICVVPIPTPVT